MNHLVPTLKNITSLFEKCHDEIWEGGKNDPAFAFDEFSKLLIIKLFDEQNNNNRLFLNPNSKDIQNYYSKLSVKLGNLFDNKINLSNFIMMKIVTLLKEVNLSEIDLDIKGKALEDFLGKTFRDEYGQYFTPRPIVDFCVRMLDPGQKDTIMDPTCGSGGFLIYSMIHLLRKYNHVNATKQLFGIEINQRIARIALMDMIIHGDGHSNIQCEDSLFLQLKKQFSIIFTNPPFGVKITNPNILKNYELGNKPSIKSEILFIEKCYKILQNHGKMCIVLPDSVLSNSSLQNVREFIKNHFKILAIISLPHHTFIHSGANVKSSLLFLEKSTITIDYLIFMSIVKNIGYDSLQHEVKNDLIEVLKEWTSKKLKTSFMINISQLIDSFSPSSFIPTTSGIKLGELCDDIFTGTTPSRKDYSDKGFKILKVRDLTSSGIKWMNSERGFTIKKPSKKLLLNDILIISSAHHPKYIGLKVDILNYIPQNFQSVYCVGEILIIRPDPQKINPYELLYFLKSETGFNLIQSCIRGQTSHIYSKDIRNIIIPKIKVDPKKITELKKMLLKKGKLEYDLYEKEQILLREF